MPEPKRPLKVFLCHAHADRDAVRALYARLKREGVDVWLDKEKLLPGADWEFEIRKAVRESDVVVVCLSKQFNQAGFRQKEVRIALEEADKKPEGEIFIIPARLEECDNLESLSKWHWVDLFESNGFQRLMMALHIRADRIGTVLRQRKSRGNTVSRTNVTREQAEPDEVSREKTEQDAIEKARLDSELLERQKNAKRPNQPKRARPNTTIVVAVIGLVGTLCAALISSPSLQGILLRTPEPTSTLVFTATQTKTPVPTNTFAPSKTPTFTPPPSLPNAPEKFYADAACSAVIAHSYVYYKYEYVAYLHWTDQSDNETGFEITRNGDLVTTVEPNTKEYKDTFTITTPYKRYDVTATYTIQSINAAGKSEIVELFITLTCR